ncbi:MAG: hypothetical protein BWY13_00894 [Euryarchaeota archaeon ADurb.Bin190]|nr:MAG: hypothetical protein BWY13_00894 [Euryarchaeota archaeon ADurb.Bin190]
MAHIGKELRLGLCRSFRLVPGPLKILLYSLSGGYIQGRSHHRLSGFICGKGPEHLHVHDVAALGDASDLIIIRTVPGTILPGRPFFQAIHNLLQLTGSRLQVSRPHLAHHLPAAVSEDLCKSGIDIFENPILDDVNPHQRLLGDPSELALGFPQGHLRLFAFGYIQKYASQPHPPATFRHRYEVSNGWKCAAILPDQRKLTDLRITLYCQTYILNDPLLILLGYYLEHIKPGLEVLLGISQGLAAETVYEREVAFFIQLECGLRQL